MESDELGLQNKDELKMLHEPMLQQVDLKNNMHFV